MSLEEFACDLGLRSGGFAASDFGECADVLLDRCLDAGAFFVGDLDARVMVLNCCFDGFDAVVGLAADVSFVAAADEVVVVAAAAVRTSEEIAGSTSVTKGQVSSVRE